MCVSGGVSKRREEGGGEREGGGGVRVCGVCGHHVLVAAADVGCERLDDDAVVCFAAAGLDLNTRHENEGGE